MDEVRRVVIIGAGQAGGETAQRLRHAGFAGDITLVGKEGHAPYQRPPLSKAYLAGKLSMERLLLRPDSVYAEERVSFLPSTKALRIDRARRSVDLDDGQALAYDALVLATGARPRRLTLPGATLNGVHLFRSAADVDSIRPTFVPDARLIIIGAGYIGLEVAAVARQLGLEVLVVESAARPLARVTSPEVAGFFLGEHTRHGVRFVLGAQLAAINGADRVTGITLADGATVPADLIVAGIGVSPEIALAQQSGLTIENGVVTDAQCRTSDAHIFAVGDCASRPIQHFDERMCRLESVHNAIEGAKIVAATITGQKPHQVEAPWFWSDQYDLKLQIAGLFQGYDRVVFRGALDARSFAAFYYKDGRLIAVDAVNRPAEYLGAKLLIQTSRTIPAETIVDESKSMKELIAAAR